MPKQERIAFYSWIEDKPSSLTIRISGGQRAKDTNTGAILAMEHKEVHFTMGKLWVEDPEILKELRRLVEKGETITEDYEVYLSHVEPPKRREDRLLKKNQVLHVEKDQLLSEIDTLKKKLAGKA